MTTGRQKLNFKAQIDAYRKNGGEFSFVFGDIHLPVEYREALGILSVRMPARNVIVTVDYNMDLGDNLDILMDKLLEEYPELEE